MYVSFLWDLLPPFCGNIMIPFSQTIVFQKTTGLFLWKNWLTWYFSCHHRKCVSHLNNFIGYEINGNWMMSHIVDESSLSIQVPIIFDKSSQMFEALHCYGGWGLLYDLSDFAVASWLLHPSSLVDCRI